MISWNIQDLLGIYLKDIIYIVGAVATFFIGRKLRAINVKKEEAALQTSELDNVEAAIGIYRTMLQDLEVKLTEAQNALEVIEERLHATIEEKRALEEENHKLKLENAELKSHSK